MKENKFTISFTGEALKQLRELKKYFGRENEYDVIALAISALQKFKELKVFKK